MFLSMFSWMPSTVFVRTLISALVAMFLSMFSWMPSTVFVRTARSALVATVSLTALFMVCTTLSACFSSNPDPFKAFTAS